MLIDIIIISEVLEHMFYSIKMANIIPFQWRKSFLSLVGPCVYNHYVMLRIMQSMSPLFLENQVPVDIC